MKTSSKERPEAVTTSLNRFSQLVRTINFDINYNRSTREYDYDSIVIEPGRFTRDCLITDIIRSVYSADAMEAIMNNYLSDPQNADYLAEFTAMQQWRAHAKQIAGQYVTDEP